MKIPREFSVDLSRVYEGDIKIDELIKKHSPYLHSLAKYALRFSTQWFLSEEEDLFQEACIWLNHSLWDWESDKRPLDEFVVYNIGARLSTTIRVERAKRRHPDRNTSRKINIWEPIEDSSGDSEGHNLLEETLPSNSINPERWVIFYEALKNAESDMTELAKEVLEVLAETDGNWTSTARLLMARPHIRQRFGTSPKSVKYRLKQKIGREILALRRELDII